MRSFIVLLILSIVLTSCGKKDEIEASVTGYTKKCVDGVEYILFASGATVAYNKDGSIRTCN